MPRVEAEIRSRDLEQMIAEPTITEEPAPIGIGITITRLLSQTDRLTFSDQFNYSLLDPPTNSYVVPRNLLENSNFEDTIDIMSGSGVSVDWAHNINSAHTLNIQSSREQLLYQLSLITSAKFDLTGSTGAGVSELTQRSGITATGEVNVTNGEITSIDITNGGSGYTSAPTIGFTGGGGTGATATAITNIGEIVNIIITDAGSGYTSAPTVTFTGGGGTGATATVTINSSGEVDSITITYGGFEYEFVPTVIITDTSGGSGANAIAVLTNGEVTDVTITDGGSGYDTSTTTVTFSTPIRTASFEAWVYVESITGSPELRLLMRSLDIINNTILDTSIIRTQDSITTGWNLLKVDGYVVPLSGQSITVSWSAPSEDGGSAIIGYHIRHRIGTNSWVEITTGISGTSYTITGLDTLTEYEIQVRAVNIVDFGDWSNSMTITTGS